MSMFTGSATIDFLLENASTYAEKKAIYALEEADLTTVGNGLISKLYKSAVSKSYINFDEIPDSKGDITKYTGYEDMMQCLSVMENICRKSNVNIRELTVIQSAISNVIGLRDVFTKGFALGKDFLILQYNTIVAACVEATACVISSFVEYTKKIDAYEFKITHNKALQGAQSIKNLETFNKSVSSGEYSKIAHIVLKTDAAKGLITESAVVITAAVISAIVVLVVMMREIVFRIFYSRMKISEYLKMQAMFLEMNRANVEANAAGLSPQKKKSVMDKQAKLAEKLSSLSDKIQVNDVVSAKKVATELKKDNATMTLDSVANTNKTDSFELL